MTVSGLAPVAPIFVSLHNKIRDSTDVGAIRSNTNPHFLVPFLVEIWDIVRNFNEDGILNSPSHQDRLKFLRKQIRIKNQSPGLEFNFLRYDHCMRSTNQTYTGLIMLGQASGLNRKFRTKSGIIGPIFFHFIRTFKFHLGSTYTNRGSSHISPF